MLDGWLVDSFSKGLPEKEYRDSLSHDKYQITYHAEDGVVGDPIVPELPEKQLTTNITYRKL